MSLTSRSRVRGGLSIASDACPQCGARLAVNGDCLRCLVSAGLVTGDPEPQDLASLLAEVDVRDADWRLGNYQILEEIGRGGMGVIYRARQRHSKRIVALKRVLSYHGDSHETLERFRREAEAAASLDHANILPIYEVGEEDGLPFFTMKLASGGSLQNAAPELRKDPRECVRLMAKVAHAVAYAHRAGILHRDLKPGNVLLDGRGEPLVSDFGLAKWIDTTSDLTRSLAIFGTPGFIAPEQAVGSPGASMPAADIYSLGAILFDLLVGRPPFLGEHAIAVMRQAAETAAPKLRAFLPNIDADIETICAKALEREPTARYHSAAELAEDLDRFLAGQPIKARPVNRITHGWRWVRRNPKLAATAAACALLAVVAVSWQLRSQRLAEQVRMAEADAHSIAFLPILNLDTARAEFGLSRSVGAALEPALAAVGPSRLTLISKLPAKWTGTGNVDELRAAAREGKSHAVVSGTVRTVGDRRRITIQLTRDNGVDVLGNWAVEAPVGEADLPRLFAEQTAREVYQATAPPPDAAENRGRAAPVNEQAQAYLNTGRLLLDRRTIADMDRAIASFEAAIAADPKSVEARSYLAMACSGRNFLLADSRLIERAIAVSREALELEPNNPTAHRGMCAVLTFTGELDEALEHGFRALECGDRSERAFGQIAFIWRQLGRPDKAIAWFANAKVSKTQPADYEALIGDCWKLLGDDEKAAQAYDAAIRFRPDLPEGWLGLSHLKLIRGEVEEARAVFHQKEKEFAEFPVARHLKAQIEFFAREYGQADHLFRALLEANPEATGTQHHGEISYRSALARLARERGQPAEAEAFLAEALARDRAEHEAKPRNPEILYRLAANEAMAGRKEAALRYLAESIASGWSDYRSPRLDPRFDAVAGDPAFGRTLDDLAERMADLRRDHTGQQTAATLGKEDDE